MKIHKRILALTSIVFILIVMVACHSAGDEVKNFPVDKDGYPLNNVIVNNKQHELKNIFSDNPQNLDINLNITEKDSPYINIILPKILPTHSWQIDEKLYPAIKKYIKENTKVDDNNQLEGSSNDLQIFTIDTTMIEGHNVIFKWINSNENEKPFKYRITSYNIKINLN